MSRRRLARAGFLVLAATLAVVARGQEPGSRPIDEGAPLELTDLPAYRAALEGKPAGAASPATFRQLWERSGEFAGRRVRVEGTLARRFRQGAVGTFPPLVEAWLAGPSGDPICVVHPVAAEGSRPEPELGARVRFEGTFLRTIRYKGADSDRLAPLVVGDRPPSQLDPPRSRPSDDLGLPTFSPVGWLLGGALALLGAGLLARHHLRSPSLASRPRRPDREPPPEFDDGV